MDAIENLLNETLDRKFKVNNEILLLAFDKDIKHLESLIYSLDNKVEDFRTDVNKRFDKVEDQIKSLDERLIVQSERLRKVEKAAFATS